MTVLKEGVFVTRADELPKGYICGNCGAFNRFSSYVYAHWRDPLIHICECEAKSEILLGKVTKEAADE